MMLMRRRRSDPERFEKLLLHAMRMLDEHLLKQTIEALEQSLLQAAISKQTAASSLFELAIVTKRSLASFSLKVHNDDRTYLKKLLICGTLQNMVLLLQDELIGWMRKMREVEAEFNITGQEVSSF